MFEENLKALFPEFDDLPHHDTLKRLLAKIDVMELENIHIELIRQLIRKKKLLCKPLLFVSIRISTNAEETRLKVASASRKSTL
jgi:hypothetical protein